MMSNHKSLDQLLLAGIMMMLLTFIISDTAQAQLLRRAFAQADPKPAEPIPPAPAQPDEPAEADVDGEEKALVIRIKATQGIVQVRENSTAPWQIAKVGMNLTIGSEIRTGLRSICQFTIDENHTVSLDRLGVVKVLDAIKKDGKIKTDVGMKYGRTQYKVETGAAEHDARVHAPSATLAVRGSFVTLEDNDAFGSRAIVDHSDNAIYKQRAPEGQVRVVEVQLKKGTIEQEIRDAGKQPPTAAMLALKETINDIGDRLGKANDLERELVALYPIYNGAPLGGGLPPPGGILDDFKDPFLGGGDGGSESEGGGSEGGPGPGDIIQGSLIVNATWTGPDPFVLFLNDPIGGQLSSVDNVPSGSSTVVRPGGPAQGNGTGSVNTATLVFGTESVVGAYGLGIGVNTVGPVGFNTFEIAVTFNDENGSVLIDEFVGVADAETPGSGFGFFLPADPGTGINN